MCCTQPRDVVTSESPLFSQITVINKRFPHTLESILQFVDI